MNYKTLILFFGLITFTVFLSACSPKSSFTTKTSNSVNQEVSPEQTKDQPTITDDQLLNQMQQDDDSNLDQQYNQLEQDLK